jgi:hypothetical protein
MEICPKESSLYAMCMKKKLVEVFPSKDPHSETCVTYSTAESRKTFTISRPKNSIACPPLAVESFALEPGHYYRLMDAVSKLSQQQQTQGR